MAIVWPCTLPVDAYAAAGQSIEVPRANCPSCEAPMGFWWGYSRVVRHEGGEHRIWVPRGRCGPCGTTHALLPAFVARHRLDSVETLGAAVKAVGKGSSGVRPVAERLGEGKVAVPLAEAAATVAGRIGQAALQGAGVGAAQAVGTSPVAGQSWWDAAKGAFTGGATGGLLGGLLEGAAPALRLAWHVPPRQRAGQAGQISGQQIHLQIDRIARAQSAQVGVGAGVGNDGELGAVFLQRGDGQADALDGQRALRRDQRQ